MMNLLLFNNFYPVITYRRVQKESDELLYTVRSLVMVRSQLPAQVVKFGPNSDRTWRKIFFCLQICGHFDRFWQARTKITVAKQSVMKRSETDTRLFKLTLISKCEGNCVIKKLDIVQMHIHYTNNNYKRLKILLRCR